MLQTKPQIFIYTGLTIMTILVIIFLMIVNPGNNTHQTVAKTETISICISGSTSVAPLMQMLIDDYIPAGNDVTFKLESTGSKTGIRAVSRGEVELGLSSRKLSQDEQQAGLETLLIANDTIAIVVHPSNPIEEINLEYLTEIFTGRIDIWSALTDFNKPITVISRETVSGTRSAFEDMINIKGMLFYRARVYNGSEGVRDALASHPGGIAYLSISFIDTSLKPIKYEGVKPDSVNVVAGRYQLKRPFYILYKKENLQPETRRFLDWILSAEGQSIVVRKWVPVR